MPYLYLLLSVASISISSVCAEFFNQRFNDRKDRTPIYIFIYLIVILAGWGILWVIDCSFDYRVLIYALLFGIGYIFSTVFFVVSVRNGPVSLTSLMMQISVVCATVWGLFFWEDAKITVIAIIGLILVVTSLAFCILGKKRTGEKKISKRWILFSILMFFGNATCVIVQKEEQIRFNGQHGFMMMFFASLLAAIAGIVLLFHSPKANTREVLKHAGVFPVIGGICNILQNIFLIILATTVLSPSVIYPVIAVGGLALTTLVSVICFRERLSGLQWFGLGMGAVAITLLNL